MNLWNLLDCTAVLFKLLLGALPVDSAAAVGDIVADGGVRVGLEVGGGDGGGEGGVGSSAGGWPDGTVEAVPLSSGGGSLR